MNKNIMKKFNEFFLILCQSISKYIFLMRIEKKNGGIPVRSSNSVFGCSGKYLEWFSVSLLKDNVLMSKNGLSMEDISHA